MPSQQSPPESALDLVDSVNLCLDACQDLTAILQFATDVCGHYSSGNLPDLAVWRGMSKIHELIAEELTAAHTKANQLYELASAKGGAQ